MADFTKVGSKLSAIFDYIDDDGNDLIITLPEVDEAKAPDAVANFNNYVLTNNTMFQRQPASLSSVILRKVETLECGLTPPAA